MSYIFMINIYLDENYFVIIKIHIQNINAEILPVNKTYQFCNYFIFIILIYYDNVDKV